MAGKPVTYNMKTGKWSGGPVEEEINRTGPGAAWETRERLRQEGIDLAKQIPGAIGQSLMALRQAGMAGKQSMRAATGQAIAGGLGQAGGAATGGGLTASLGSIARQRGLDEAAYGTQHAIQEAAMNERRAQGRLEAHRFAQEAGDVWTIRQQRMAEYDSRIATIVAPYVKAGDEEGARAAVTSLLSAEGDPEMRAFLLSRASQVERAIKGGDTSFFEDLLNVAVKAAPIILPAVL